MSAERQPGHTRAGLDWSALRAVLLDMDGVLLDLRFDNDFWHEQLPREVVAVHGGSLTEVRSQLARRYAALRGTLSWYDVRYWSDALSLDVSALQTRFAERVSVHPGAVEFIAALAALRLRPWLVTNAHPETLALKLAASPLRPLFERIICAHDFGMPKEHPGFWARMATAHPFDPNRALLVDDNLAALASAGRHGIRYLRAISEPDSGQPPQATWPFLSAARLADLTPCIEGHEMGHATGHEIGHATGHATTPATGR